MLDGWHLDKRVPVALILVILGHIAVSIWYLAQMASQLSAHDVRIGRLEDSDHSQAAVFGSIAEHLARIDERTTFLVEQQRRADRRLAP